MKHLRNFVFSALFLTLAFSAFAQKPETGQLENKTAVQTSVSLQELKLNSKLMAREMPYRVILPAGYEANKAQRFPVLYLLHGLTGHYNNWTENTKLKEFAASYNLIIVTP